MMFEGLPSFISVAEAAIETVHGALWPEEEARIAGAVEKRRREYAAGRVLARRALAALGAHDVPIVAGEDRVPRWPPGVTGSISHSARYAAAAVARLNDVAGIGIDLEEVGRFRVELERHLFSVAEIARHLEGHSADERQANAAAMFSAKEAFYKAQYPLTGRRLGFHDVEIELDVARGAFEAWRVAESQRRFEGYLSFGGGNVGTVMWFPTGRHSM